MGNIFEEFDKIYDTKALAEEIKNSSDTPVYKNVPDGEYEVSIIKMELVSTKETHKPMVSVWFKILNGDYKGQMIFMNQIIDYNGEHDSFKVKIVNDFLRSLDSDLNIEFQSYTQYTNLLMDVMEEIDGKFEYGLKYTHNRKGFAQFEITEVFELEWFHDLTGTG